MDMLIEPRQADLSGERTTTLANAIYLRLSVPKGTFWADPTLGSRLHELRREKDVERVKKLAVQYAQQALQGLVDQGRATAVDVSAKRPGNGSLILEINVTTASGGRKTFEHNVRVI
ncbi:phage GP46 family protein [Carnimonas bestiolae]|uniref:phage GP46 family protein n=1 Tax=Carnimonas bestiolae TaxID=3402172 RepID=UPI003F4AB752